MNSLYTNTGGELAQIQDPKTSFRMNKYGFQFQFVFQFTAHTVGVTRVSSHLSLIHTQYAVQLFQFTGVLYQSARKKGGAKATEIKVEYVKRTNVCFCFGLRELKANRPGSPWLGFLFESIEASCRGIGCLTHHSLLFDYASCCDGPVSH